MSDAFLKIDLELGKHYWMRRRSTGKWNFVLCDNSPGKGLIVVPLSDTTEFMMRVSDINGYVFEFRELRPPTDDIGETPINPVKGQLWTNPLTLEHFIFDESGWIECKGNIEVPLGFCEYKGGIFPHNGIAESEEVIREWFEWHDQHSNTKGKKYVHDGRNDLFVFNLLDSILDKTGKCIIEAAEHDIIYLSVHLEDLVGRIDSYDVHRMVSCGVMIGDDDNLEMYV